MNSSRRVHEPAAAATQPVAGAPPTAGCPAAVLTAGAPARAAARIETRAGVYPAAGPGTVRARALACALAVVVGLAGGITGCDIVDLHRLEVETSPASHNEVVGQHEAVSVRFSRAIRGASGERAFVLESEHGELDVDFERHANGFDAIPVERPEPGVRHALRLDGSVTDERGLDHEINIYLPFFFGSSERPPRAELVSPAAGSDTDVHAPIELSFTEAMDTDSVERAFSTSPDAEVRFQWGEGGTLLTITPDTPWEPVTVYTWEVPRSARSADGVRLASQAEASFFTQADSVPPALVELGSVTVIDGRYLETPELSAHDSLHLLFSRPVQFASVREAVSIQPAIAGAVEQLDEAEYVYRTDAKLDTHTRYTLTVSSDLRDMSGNSPIEETRHSFTAHMPRQQVQTIESYWNGDTATVALDPAVGETTEVGIMQPDGTNRLEIDFALPFDTKDSRDRVLEAISFEAVLPERAANPDIERLSWNYDRTVLRIRYAGLINSRDQREPTVYRLRVAPGDASAPEGAEGLAEALTVYLKTEMD